ncbi:MAG: T9SS type A sorting domain-containing protein [Sphingobacteriaceae bacterium]|nr:T9SS type A sorting domain-containing protein [Sphingobacteriaceae bacterium]
MKRIILLFSAIILLSSNTSAQFNLMWAKSVGGVDPDEGLNVVTDATGNIYTVGTFSGTADLDPCASTLNFTSIGDEDVYVIKQNSIGGLIWAKTFGGTNTDIPAGVGVDNSGNVYISGTYGGAIDLDPSAATFSFFTGSIEVFVSKLDASGNFVWGVSMGSGANDRATAMKVDGSGNVYTTGSFEGMMDFDPGAGTFNITPFGSGGTDVFVSKLNTNGNFVWAVNMGGVGVDDPKGIVVDALFNVYVTGSFEDVADFDTGASTFTLSSLDQQDAFVCKLDGNGAFVWAKQFGGLDRQSGTGLALEGTTNVYITGEYQNTVDLDPSAGTFTVTSTGALYSSYAVKLSSAGNFVWAKNISGSNDVLGNKIVISPAGFVYWSGYNKGIADLDPGAGTNNSNATTGFDTFVTKLDASGGYMIAESFPYVWNSFVVNTTSEIVLTGRFTLTRDFDPTATSSTITSAGSADGCIVKLNQLTTSIYENETNVSQVVIYPNPNNGSFVINAEEGSKVRVVNALGQEVAAYIISNGEQKINLNECKSGIYFLMIGSNGKQSCQKFVIAN